jgi:hypothetical protein
MPKRRPAPTRVETSEPWQVRHWCRKWGCTPDVLKAVVARVGSSAEDIDDAFAALMREAREVPAVNGAHVRDTATRF